MGGWVSGWVGGWVSGGVGLMDIVCACAYVCVCVRMRAPALAARRGCARPFATALASVFIACCWQALAGNCVASPWRDEETVAHQPAPRPPGVHGATRQHGITPPLEAVLQDLRPEYYATTGDDMACGFSKRPRRDSDGNLAGPPTALKPTTTDLSLCGAPPRDKFCERQIAEEVVATHAREACGYPSSH